MSSLPEIFEQSKTIERDGKVFRADFIKRPKAEEPEADENLETKCADEVDRNATNDTTGSKPGA